MHLGHITKKPLEFARDGARRTESSDLAATVIPSLSAEALFCRHNAHGDDSCKNDSRPASASVELAVLLPLLCFLFVIAIDYGRIFYFSLSLENCARSGAIYGSDSVAAAQSPYTSIEQAALAEALDLTPEPTVTSTNGIDASGHPYVAVTAVWHFHTITNFPNVPSVTTLSRTVQMRVAPTVPN